MWLLTVTIESGDVLSEEQLIEAASPGCQVLSRQDALLHQAVKAALAEVDVALCGVWDVPLAARASYLGQRPVGLLGNHCLQPRQSRGQDRRPPPGLSARRDLPGLATALVQPGSPTTVSRDTSPPPRRRSSRASRSSSTRIPTSIEYAAIGTSSTTTPVFSICRRAPHGSLRRAQQT